jgi:catechol 2,3-dioxygenase-like lactoylglutathione lyase family enzyme
MRIRHVTIEVPDPAETARFFREALGASAHEADGAVTVAIGDSLLTLEHGDRPPEGYYHLAFDIPENAIAQARDLLRDAIGILPAGDDGIITSQPAWLAHSFYFNAPGNLNLELIARHRLDNAVSHPFTVADIQGITEVGVAVPDPVAAAAAVRDTFGIEPFDTPAETFAAMGSDEGLIILVKRGRIWLPTDDQTTTDRRVRVALDGVRGELTVGNATIAGA